MSENRATVLIVDDHRLTAELTGMALEASGFTVRIEEDGPAALAAPLRMKGMFAWAAPFAISSSIS